MATKNVTMKCEKRSFTDKETKVKQEFDCLFVTVNGIDIRVKAADSTGKQILVEYLNK